MKRLSLSLFSVLLAASWAGAAPARKLEYNRDIRPIFAENCFACHGPDKAARKGKLRLDIREDAIKGEAIVPGKPDKSELITRIHSEKKTKLMPPAKSHKKLTAAQKATLKKWIEQGAEYQAHWSFISPKRPDVPAVKDAKWARNPLDRFILSKLEKAGLKPAPQADRRSLARRAALDLTGLPPKVADVEVFLKDKKPGAYERYIDKLINSLTWGEHRGRYWLDAARYADTHGIHFDNYREVWSYRDWVIRAFNRNMTWDRFTIENIAGDLLPNRTIDQQIGSGFNRCNITTNEGGAIADEYLVLYTRDRTETVSAVWMGLTANCAVCHDHKFDPISQKEFYSLAAFFNNTTQNAMDGNIPNTPPTIVVPKMEDRPRWERLLKQLIELRRQSEERKTAARKDFAAWLKTAKVEDVSKQVPTKDLKWHLPLDERKGTTVNYTLDGKEHTAALPAGHALGSAGKDKSGLSLKPAGAQLEFKEIGDFERTQGFTMSLWVKLAGRGHTGALLARMDNGSAYRGWDVWMENDRVGMHIVNKWPDDALKVVARNPLQPGKWTHIVVAYDGSSKASGVRVYLDGVLQATDVQADKLKSTIKTAVPLKIGSRNTSERIARLAIKDVRLYTRTLTALEASQLGQSPRLAALLSKPANKRTPQETNAVFNWYLASRDEKYQALAKKLAGVQQEEVGIRSRGTIAHVMQESKNNPTAYILNRGDYDKRKEQVKPSTPAALPPMPADLPRNRLGLAKWLIRAEHPLMARVTVNRFWQEIFGQGLVRTSNDFGITGELPSHPELLDWLAVEFRESGWDVKRFYRMLLTSATYRQAALITSEKREKDPFNTLLSRGPRFRMDAEMIRDHALAASGLLVPKIGGASVKPYQPEGVWEAVAMIGSNTREYKRDSGESLYRRSMYTFWKRSAPPASMDIFNAPSREVCAVRRERTNTPLQALVTLNDPQFVEAARVLAEKTLKRSTKLDERIDFLGKRLVARPFKPAEVKVIKELLEDLLTEYKDKPTEAKKLIAFGESKADATIEATTLAGWTMLVNSLMNLDEVLNK